MKFWQGLQNRQKSREDDLRRELSADLELEAEERRDAGVSSEEARYAAQRALGNRTQVEEEIRDLCVWTWFENLGQDIRYAFWPWPDSSSCWLSLRDTCPPAGPPKSIPSPRCDTN
ncbi:MAG: permease prefix domain 1-containing protein [Terriglobia bacterium]|jgi:hypothetical protein